GELGLDLPGCRLSDAEPATELDRTDPLLGLRDQIHGAKPSRQRHLGGVEARAGRQRGLPAAGVAFIEMAKGKHTMLPPTALRTYEAIRPAPARERLAAPLLAPVEGRETGL